MRKVFSSRSGALLLACAASLAAAQSDDGRSRDFVDQPAAVERLAYRSLLLDIAMAGERLVAVGERGHVLLSDDDGASWRQAKQVPTRTMLTAVTFADANNGWAVGHDEIILNTTDGGETWSRSHYAPDAQQPLLDVWFADARRGIAIGAFGAYFTTEDGGATWTARKFESKPLVPPPPAPRAAAGEDEFEDIPPDYHLNRIVASGNRLYVAAESGQLYRSDDAGASWLSLPSPYEGSFFGLLPLRGDAILAFGLRGNLFRSDDAGSTWRRIETGTTSMLTYGVWLAEDHVAIVGLSGTVLYSTDGGNTFALSQQEDRKGLSAALGAGRDAIVAVGEGGARRILLK